MLTEVTCSGSNDTCGSSIMVIKSFPFKERTVTKGCVSSTAPYRSISISPSDIIKMSLEEETCGTDLCNKETIPESEDKVNELNCYSCVSPGKDCNSDTMRNMKCRGQQNKCLDVRVLGAVGGISNTHFKGCGNVNCSNSMIFANKMSSVFVKCCNENFCNSEIDFHEPDKKPNGVQCYGCNTLNGENCTLDNTTTTECYGNLTACFELVGIKTGDGKPTPAVLKGCATPNMCDSFVLPLLQNLKSPRVKCCNGSLCNKNFTKDTLQASGYFPGTGNVNGHGNSSSSTGYHTGENRGNSSNVFSGPSPPGGYGNSNGSHSMPKDNGYGYGNGSGNTNSSNNQGQKPPVSKNNSTENGFYHGDGTSRSNSSTHNNGLISNPMPSGVNNNGSNNGTNLKSSNSSSMTSTGGSYNGSSNSNHNNGSDWSNSTVHNPHMMPPGRYNGSLNYNSSFNGSGHSYIGNRDELIAKLSNATGLSPTVLSQKLNGVDISNPSNLISVLTTIPGFDANRLPPELKTAMFGNSNTYPIGPGFNYNMPPPKWNASSFGNRDELIAKLSNATGLSPTVLSQKLNGVDISNPSNLISVLTTIPGFDANRLPPELKTAMFGNSNTYPIGPGFNYNMPPPKWNLSSFGNREELINKLSTAAGISPTLLTQKLNGVDISNPSNLASVLSSIPTFDANRLSPELKTAIFGYNSNVGHAFPNNSGYNINTVSPKWNSSSLANNSYFLNVLSNMTNISTAVLSQRFNELSKNNQSNPTGLIFSLPGFDLYRLPPDLRADIFGNDTNISYANTGGFNNNMVHPGSSFGNNSHFGTNNTDLSLAGKGTNDSDSNNITLTPYNGAISLRSKAGVLAIVFTILFLLLN